MVMGARGAGVPRISCGGGVHVVRGWGASGAGRISCGGASGAGVVDNSGHSETGEIRYIVLCPLRIVAIMYPISTRRLIAPCTARSDRLVFLHRVDMDG